MTQQYYGMFFSSVTWQVYACGTYRRSMGADGARATFKSFLGRLEQAMKSPISCIAVLERRSTSGLGKSESPFHWHFVLAAPPQYQEALLLNTSELWRKQFGNCKADAYKPELPGVYYIAKTAKSENFDWSDHNLHLMDFPKNCDLYEEQQSNGFVPDHVRDKTVAETLVVRAPGESSSQVSEEARRCRSVSHRFSGLASKGGHRGRHR